MNDVSIARSVRNLLIAGAWLLGATALGDEPPKAPPAGPILHLIDGGMVPGTFEDSDQTRTIRWKSDAFASPFEFPRDEVVSIRYPAADNPPAPVGTFGFELAGGDVLYGSLVELDKDNASLEVAKVGKVQVERSRLERIFRRRDGGDLIYDGPNGLAGWKEVAPARAIPEPGVQVIPAPAPALIPAPAPARGIGFDVTINGNNITVPATARPNLATVVSGWMQDGRRLRAARPGAAIQADLGLPARACIDLELAWTLPTRFDLAFGVSDDEKSVARAFRLEVWDKHIIAVRENDTELSVIAVQSVPDGPGRTRLRIYLDQTLGTIAVYSEGREFPAKLKFGGPSDVALPGVRLTNFRGDLRVERLRISRWDGEPPSPVQARESFVRTTDRATIPGKVERFDPASHEFVIKDKSGESRVAEERLDSITFPRQDEVSLRSIRVSYQDGTQLGGEWSGVGGGKLLLTVPGVVGLLKLPQEGLRSVDVLKREAKLRDFHALAGNLEIDGLRIPGYLVDTGGEPGVGPLVWQPLSGGPPSAIRPEASGRIIYRYAQRGAVPRPLVVQRDVMVNAIPNAANVVRNTPLTTTEIVMPLVRRCLYLRTGDIIPVEVTKIDETGVFFRTKFSETNFVANEKVKAVELAPEDPATLIQVDKAKLERLLTLPRMQRDTPPKHLIRSTNGDILRGTVIGLDDKTIGIEVRLEEKVFPRDRISRIIWLHADELDPTKKPAEPPKADPPTTVQAIRSDGVRLTFAAEGFVDGSVRGKSEALGDCRVRVEELDQLLFGGAVQRETAQLAYQNFKLQLAPEPKAVLFERGESTGGAPAGTEAPLVGKAAPDFQLDLLGGGKFHLAEAKGQVIVLDFWATWCGPCLQAMPQIDRVTREFEDKGVKLIAVNLQETPAKINALLERQKLSPTVALDRDGVVAAKYGANAIPQTVVIDREGKVTRLFIGSSPNLEDQLRDALKALMPPD